MAGRAKTYRYIETSEGVVRVSAVKDIMYAMEKLAPQKLADTDDNVGLLIGREDAKVERILVSLDADIFAIREAIEQNVDLIVCHHPVIFNPIKNITQTKLLDLIENKIAVFVAHTNVDWVDGGINDVLAEKFGLCDVRPLKVSDNGAKWGRAGNIEPMSLGELVKKVNNTLGGDIKYVGDKERIVSKVALCGGGGGFLMPAEGYDVYISADFRYHESIAAETQGICLIDAGHFEMENVIVEVLANYLKKEYNDIAVIASARKNSQFKYE